MHDKLHTNNQTKRRKFNKPKKSIKEIFNTDNFFLIFEKWQLKSWPEAKTSVIKYILKIKKQLLHF